jgi:EpsI family protein
MSGRAQIWAWAPAALLFVGIGATHGGIREQHHMPLRAPLETSIPAAIDGYDGEDLVISEAEQQVAGMDTYVLRQYTREGTGAESEYFSVYVGYYDRQMQGKTIHSPKNCLPGGGWEPLTADRPTIQTPAGQVPVNRYLIQNGNAQALVLYWYQGRGRVAANEYTVKWHLLRDQALHGRSDEALVRVIVPVTKSEGEAFEQAARAAAKLVPAVSEALPT